MSGRIFFYVQHLLGIGHLRRAAILARTLAEGGFDVLLVSGGAPVQLDLGSARFHQLPPVRARDEQLRELSRLDGAPLDEDFREARRRELLALLRTEAPDVLVTEQFPFGRTQLRFELLPLLEVAHALRPRPLIVSSVRDVVRRSASAARIEETIETLSVFDLVLAHADPAIASLAASFAGWQRIADRTVHTGFVVPPFSFPSGDPDAGRDEVVVSVGGGAVGAPLLKAAIAARPMTALKDRRWRLLLGGNLPDAERAALAAGQGVVVEPARADFPRLLSNAVLSISQAGYNTVMETLRYADRAVLVPFSTERETEQSDRARLLMERGMAVMVDGGTLSGERLAEGIEQALAGPSLRSFAPCDFDGAAATVRILRERLSR